MSDQRFHITYAAHTSSCSFLLDGEGICRRIVLLPTRSKRRESSRTASRCVGAQYVASLDGSAAGGLLEMPRVGAAMLFARIDDNGRISLVRTGVVTSFESKGIEDPFLDSGAVETSAPQLESRAPRESAIARRRQPVEERPAADASPHADPDPDPEWDAYFDPSERTQRIHAARPEDVAAASRNDSYELATAEYLAPAEEYPFERRGAEPGRPATLRNPHRDTIVDREEDDYAAPSAPSASAPSPAPLEAQRAAVVNGWDTRVAPALPSAFHSDVQVSRRRRGG